MSAVSSAEVIDLISDLVRIESVTPWLVEGGAGEAAVAAYLADWLSDLPVEVVLDEIAPGRVNLLATLKGTGGGPTLCFNAHADTVGYAGWPDEALVPRLDGDRLYGLGAADDKGCCAAALLALRVLATSGEKLRGDLVVACVADEEGVSLGTEHLVKTLQADAAVALEADELPKVVVEHQGFGWLDVVFYGRAAHGSAPDAGVDAIVGLAEALSRLHRGTTNTSQRRLVRLMDARCSTLARCTVVPTTPPTRASAPSVSRLVPNQVRPSPTGSLRSTRSWRKPALCSLVSPPKSSSNSTESPSKPKATNNCWLASTARRRCTWEAHWCLLG